MTTREPLRRLSAVNDALRVGDRGLIGFQLVDAGGWVGVVTFEACLVPGIWAPIVATRYDDGTSATTASTVGLYHVDGAGLFDVRVRLSTATSGALDVAAVPFDGGWRRGVVVTPVPTDSGNRVTVAGEQRVTVAGDRRIWRS